MFIPKLEMNNLWHNLESVVRSYVYTIPCLN